MKRSELIKQFILKLFKDFNFKIEDGKGLRCNLISNDLVYDLKLHKFLNHFKESLKLDYVDNYAINAFYFNEEQNKYYRYYSNCSSLYPLFSDLSFEQMLKTTGGKVNAKVLTQYFLSQVYIFKSEIDCLEWFKTIYFETYKNNDHSKLIIYINEDNYFLDLEDDSCYTTRTIKKLFLLCSEYVEFEKQIIKRKNRIFNLCSPTFYI